MANDQDEAIEVLSDPATHGGAEVEVIETHAALVFLAGEDALKIKRAVRYDYLDFTTLEAREQMLRRELALNSPAAPEIYLDVVPLARGDGGLELDGGGEPVEWVLRMRRFDTEDELSRIAERGEVTDALARDLGVMAFDYHRKAEPRDADGATLIREIVDELDAAFAEMQDSFGEHAVETFRDRLGAAYDAQARLLSARAAQGKVRRCHGDLHLRNIVLLEGRPVPFDALEFDERLGTCDVLYDLAFLLMDLRHRGLCDKANLALNAWLQEAAGAEDDGLAALPLFLSVRAAIRAMVTEQKDRASGHAGESTAEARRYLAEALGDLRAATPVLVAVGGRSGTGKTTIARRLAPDVGDGVGAVHLRSDLERKALAEVDPLTRLDASAYTNEATAAVYDRLCARAGTILASGRAAILDATFLDASERRAAEAVADRVGVPFAGLWLKAGTEELGRRVAAREGDASDADATVVAQQEEPDRTGWSEIDASDEVDHVARAALRAVSGDR